MTLQGVMLLTVNPHGGSYTAIHSGLNADFGASTSDVPLSFIKSFPLEPQWVPCCNQIRTSIVLPSGNETW